MSDICFKNLAANYNEQHYYSDSVTYSESATMQEIKTLGNTNGTSVMANPVEGTVSMSYYLTEAAEASAMTGQFGKTGFKSFSTGPLSVSDTHLTSWSIEGSANELVKGSASYTYYGSMISGSAGGSSGDATITPAVGGKTTLTLKTPAGSTVLNEISSFSYSIDQSYEVTYALGSLTPSRVKMTEGSMTLEVDGPTDSVDWTQSIITGDEGLCPPTGDGPGGWINYVLKLRSACSTGENTIFTVTNSGRLESKSITIAPNTPVQSSFTLVNKFPNAEIQEEC